MSRSFAFIVAVVLAFSLSACAATEHIPAPAETDAVTPSETATLPLDAVMPVDPAVRIDTLGNGLVYYLRHNDEPKNRAELRLVVNAGSVLEDDDQRGLAHFLEHMLFNGTRRFEENELVNFLERTGMRFGPDVNAYTSFDETVYMLQIPTDSSEIVAKSFDVLEDWAAYATLSEQEIDKERGVVLEEWRRGTGAGGRIRDQILPVLLANSPYKDRLPIGDTTIINNADYDTLRRYYRDWYRPDLMAVVAVGDFNLDQFENLIREHFTSLTNPNEQRPRSSFEVPDHKETFFKVATDPEYPVTQVQVNFKQDAEPFETVDDYRNVLIGGLFNSMLNKRFAEIARQGNAPFLGAGVSKGSLVRPAVSYSLGAQVQEDSILVGLDALLTEAARVRQHGFTETELERDKQETLRAYERAFNERENSESSSYAGEYVNNFLEDEPIPGIAYEYELVQEVLPGITVQEVNARAAELLAEQNRVVLVLMPDKAGLTPPTETELAAVLADVQQKDIAPYVDDVSDAPLVAAVPQPAAVTSKRETPEVGVTEMTLANGVRVVLKPTDFKQDEVVFRAFSPGGSSLVENEDYLDASSADALVSRSGVGTFNRTALQKKLSGKVASVSPYISELEEGLRGGASPEDLETMFQLIYLYFTAPRADSAALAAYQNEQIASLTNRSSTPFGPFQDSLIVALCGNHPRCKVPTIEQVQNLNLQNAYRIYQDRFADAGDFTFLFVGNFDPDTLQTLAQTYLGTLPSTGRTETWRDMVPDPPGGVVTKTVKKGQAPQSQVAIIFRGPFDYARLPRHRLRSLEGVLDIRLREELREKRSGVYSTTVQSSASDKPEAEYQLVVVFGCDPERAEELSQAVFEEIEKIQTEGISADDLAKIKEQQRRERETSVEENSFWLGVLDFYYSQENENLLDVLRYNEMIESLTAEDIQAAARQYLNEDNYIKAVLYPEGFGE